MYDEAAGVGRATGARPAARRFGGGAPTVAVLLALVTVLVGAGSAKGAATITELPGFQPSRINESGAILGTPESDSGLVIWTDGLTTPLQSGRDAIDFADDGTALGFAEIDGQSRTAFWLDGGGSPVPLATSSSSSNQVVSARTLSPDGERFGGYVDELSPDETRARQAAVRGMVPGPYAEETGTPGDFSTPSPYQQVEDITDSGRAVGATLTGGFVWEPDGTVTEIPFEAYAINAAGWVAGVSVSGSSQGLWKLRSPAGVVTTLPCGDGEVYDINEAGHVLGLGRPEDSGDVPDVKVWRDGACVKVTDLLGDQATGWTELEARSFNDEGQIVGTGLRDDEYTGFLIHLDPGITVTETTDEADADEADGVCDVDAEAPGLQCTLRAALEEATAQGIEQDVEFDLEGDGPPRIAPASPLPAVPAGVVVDATTQPGEAPAADGPAEVVLDGAGAGDDAVGLELEGAAAAVRGLKVTGFDGPGVKATGANAAIAANAITQNGSGVEIAGPGVKVGGVTVADRNFIWKNGATDEEGEQVGAGLGSDPSDAEVRSVFLELGAGVVMTSSSARDAVVEGNAIGFGPAGSVELQSSIGILVAPVDGDPSGAKVRDNDITGNLFGVLALPISGALGDPAPLELTRNRIGESTGARPLESLGAYIGVMTIRSPGVVIGTPGAGNTIRNTVGAIVAIGEGGLQVQGNTIGTGGTWGEVIERLKSGTSTRPALDGMNVLGVTLVDNTGARVGGASGAGNEIGPCLVCVQLGGLTSTGNDVSGNAIGVAESGNDTYPQELGTVGAIVGMVVGGGLDNTVGLFGPNAVRGAGIGAMVQHSNGLGVYGNVFDETLVGTVVADADRLEFGQTGKGNEVTDSFIGMLVTGWEPTQKELAAAGIPQEQWNEFDRRLAYTLPASESLLNVINAVEPDAEVEQAVALNPAPATARAARGRQEAEGVFGTDDLSMTGNRFGRTADGAARANVVSAWMLGDVRGVEVEDNTIAHSRAGGVWLGPSAAGHDVERVRLSGNRIFANYSVGSPLLTGIRGLGLDHLERAAPEVYENAFGPTPPDPGDADSGPNGFQNHPVLSTVERTAGGLHVRGVASGKPGTSLTVELFANEFCNPFDHGEGERPIVQTFQLTTGADGTAPLDVTVAAPAGFTNHLTATSTGPEGTSEFSACVAVTDPAAVVPPPGPPGPAVPSPPAPPGPPAPPPPADALPPKGKASVTGSPKAGQPITIRVSSNEAGTVAAKGTIRTAGGAAAQAAAKRLVVKLKGRSSAIRAGQTIRLELKPKGRKAIRRLKRAVRRGTKATAVVKVTFTDRSRNRSARTLRIRVRR